MHERDGYTVEYLQRTNFFVGVRRDLDKSMTTELPYLRLQVANVIHSVPKLKL